MNSALPAPSLEVPDPTRRFGFPGSVPDPGVLEAFREHLEANVNLYGMHVRQASGAIGALPALERRTITGAARLAGMPGDTLGYLCSGASEAALFAAWVARRSGIGRVLISAHSHTAVRKALAISGLEGGTTLAEAPLDATHLEDALEAVPEDAPLLAAITWINPVHAETDALGEVIPRLRRRRGPTLVYVDGAVGALLGPVVRGETLDGLDPDILGLDFHKVAQAPVGTGAVLYREGLHERVRLHSGYLPYGEDSTVCGSRNAAFAAAASASLGLAEDGTLAKRFRTLRPWARSIRERLGDRLTAELFPYFLVDIGPWPPPEEVTRRLAGFEVHPFERAGRALARICLSPGQDADAFDGLVRLLEGA